MGDDKPGCPDEILLYPLPDRQEKPTVNLGWLLFFLFVGPLLALFLGLLLFTDLQFH
ncbi:MAG TPA: hypothetical protein VIQ80_01800 [Candidatus Saccharimonadales bacterium]